MLYLRPSSKWIIEYLFIFQQTLRNYINALHQLISVSLIQIAAMARAVKLFEPLDYGYELLGIQRYEVETKDRVTFKFFFLLGCMFTFFSSVFAFFLNGAKTVAERGDSFFAMTVHITSAYTLYMYAVERMRINNLIRDFEDMFEESK